jgi:hypothetical protein
MWLDIMLEAEDEKKWKHYHDTIWDGTKIYIVDGNYVRSNIANTKENGIDFVEGGHDLVYKFIPKGEIWVEKMLSKQDEKMNALHEIYEHTLQKHLHQSYDTAHENTQTVERAIREKG